MNLPCGYCAFDFAALSDKIKSGSNYTPIVSCDSTRVWAEDLQNETRAVFKLYHHRGPISWQREKIFKFRVQREFEALTYLEKKGIPCSQPLFWSYGHCPEFGRCELLVTREIPETVSLHSYIDKMSSGDRHIEFTDLYRLIGKIHENGIYHGALFATNILISNGPEKGFSFHIIDLPMAMIFPKDIRGTRMAWYDLLSVSMNLQRRFGAEYCEQYLSAYGLNDNLSERFISNLNNYRPTKHTRNRIRTEFRVRELVSKFF